MEAGPFDAALIDDNGQRIDVHPCILELTGSTFIRGMINLGLDMTEIYLHRPCRKSALKYLLQ